MNFVQCRYRRTKLLEVLKSETVCLLNQGHFKLYEMPKELNLITREDPALGGFQVVHANAQGNSNCFFLFPVVRL